RGAATTPQQRKPLARANRQAQRHRLPPRGERGLRTRCTICFAREVGDPDLGQVEAETQDGRARGCLPAIGQRTPSHAGAIPLSDGNSASLSRAEYKFRPCLRCRPELAPGNAPIDALSRTAKLAASRISEAIEMEDAGLEEVAAELGIGSRHLRR